MINPLTKYDVVIVGAGLAGAIIAYELGRKGKRVLVLEAGPADPPNRAAYMEQFYLANAKVPESPYPPDPAKPDPSGLNAPRPSTLDLKWANDPTKSYLIQNPPNGGGSGKGLTPFASTYERLTGGTMWHWLCLQTLRPTSGPSGKRSSRCTGRARCRRAARRPSPTPSTSWPNGSCRKRALTRASWKRSFPSRRRG